MNILSENQPYTKLYDSVKQETRCRIASELFGRLEYRFNRYPSDKFPNGFYKFIAPSQHRLYREGDSWIEELNVDRKTFAKAFDKIGVRYKSKSDYIAAREALGNGLFKGLPYASYYERPTHMMFFIKNPLWHCKTNVEKCASSATNSRSRMGKFPVRFYIQKKTSILSLYLSHKKDSESKRKEEIKTNEIEQPLEQPISHQMIEIWSEITNCDKSVPLRKYHHDRLMKAYTNKFDSSVDKWRSYCTKIASSKFLMGETASKFNLNLGFALKTETIEKVQDGYYTMGDRKIIISAAQQDKLMTAEILQIESTSEPQVIKQFRKLLIKRKGLEAYKSWIKPCRLELRQDNALIINTPMRFYADWLKSGDWSVHIESVMCGLFEKILIFEPQNTKIFHEIIDWEVEKKRRSQSLSIELTQNKAPPMDAYFL